MEVVLLGHQICCPDWYRIKSQAIQSHGMWNDAPLRDVQGRQSVAGEGKPRIAKTLIQLVRLITEVGKAGSLSKGLFQP
eukprot:Skav209826  [mRNA]  locus=scaffold2703:28994:30739:- [translate_table: standard]